MGNCTDSNFNVRLHRSCCSSDCTRRVATRESDFFKDTSVRTRGASRSLNCLLQAILIYRRELTSDSVANPQVSTYKWHTETISHRTGWSEFQWSSFCLEHVRRRFLNGNRRRCHGFSVFPVVFDCQSIQQRPALCHSSYSNRSLCL